MFAISYKTAFNFLSILASSYLCLHSFTFALLPLYRVPTCPKPPGEPVLAPVTSDLLARICTMCAIILAAFLHSLFHIAILTVCQRRSFRLSSIPSPFLFVLSDVTLRTKSGRQLIASVVPAVAQLAKACGSS